MSHNEDDRMTRQSAADARAAREDDEVASDSASDVSELDPESAVLAPVQRRIEEQLRRHLHELTQQLRESNGELTALTREREEAGVELYNTQQRLAKLQETLEAQHEAHQQVKQEHDERLQQREALSSDTAAAQRRVEDMQRQYDKQHEELGKLSETLLRVSRYNEELKSQVALERRAAHKTEDDIARLEREKQQQDALVLSLQERAHALEDEAATLHERLTAQQQETQRARDTLAEAMSEMEAINMEKKQLVQQWRSSLVGMQRRQEAMRKTEEALQQQKDELQMLEAEIARYRRDIRGVQDDNSKQRDVLARLDNEQMVLQRQMDVLREQQEEGARTLTLLQDAAARADGDAHGLEQQLRRKQAELADMQKQMNKHNKSMADMDARVLEQLSAQTTLKQESQGVLHEIETLRAAIRAKEQQVTQMENELARIRVDTLQSTAYNDTLQATLAEVEAEVQSRLALIERMQTDIRHRSDDVDRKQKQLDQLNSQYEQLMSAHGGDKANEQHVGPLEATINSLTKAIATRSSENEALQHEWIKLQTELVNCKNTMNEINEAIFDSQAKSNILAQKRDRLLASVAQAKQEVATLEHQSSAMHLEMKRVNTLLSRNTATAEAVASETSLLESELVRRLEDKHREALQLEDKLEQARQQKREVVQQIMDCERDILFWERKLQLARETEMALDPTIGKAEMEKMRKEIVLMEQRVAQLQREQRFFIDEMQRLVDHRDVLRSKGQAVQQAAERQRHGVTRLSVEKENARLFRELNTKRQEAQAKEQAVKDSLAAVERAAAEVDGTQREIAHMDEQLQHLRQQLAAAQRERATAEDERRLRQSTLQRLRDGQGGAYQLSCYPEDVPAATAQLEHGRRAVVDVMEQLAQQYPDLADDLHHLASNV